MNELKEFLLSGTNQKELMERVSGDLNITVDHECSRLVCDINGDTGRSFEEITEAIIYRVVVAIDTFREDS